MRRCDVTSPCPGAPMLNDPGSRSWIHVPGSKILDPGSWLNDPGSRILTPGPRSNAKAHNDQGPVAKEPTLTANPNTEHAKPQHGLPNPNTEHAIFEIQQTKKEGPATDDLEPRGWKRSTKWRRRGGRQTPYSPPGNGRRRRRRAQTLTPLTLRVGEVMAGQM